MNVTRTQAWYREPWPWLLMAGPAAVVLAGMVTAWLAFNGNDGLVVDDYYKQGLAINKSLARSDAAERLGVQARLDISNGRVRVTLANAGVRGTLYLRLIHPTRAGMDQKLGMVAVAAGVYEGQLQTLQPGRWHVVLEERDWRLGGDWIQPASGPLTLGGRSIAAAQAGRAREGGQ